ncbi:hypothetical protein VPH35_051750 [Triticum aestivum]
MDGPIASLLCRQPPPAPCIRACHHWGTSHPASPNDGTHWHPPGVSSLVQRRLPPHVIASRTNSIRYARLSSEMQFGAYMCCVVWRRTTCVTCGSCMQSIV